MPKHLDDSQLVESNWLTIQDFEYVCFNLAREELTYNEPIPDYSTREQSLLESALSSPRQTFGGASISYLGDSVGNFILFFNQKSSI